MRLRWHRRSDAVPPWAFPRGAPFVVTLVLALVGCGSAPPAEVEIEAEPILSAALAHRTGEPRLTIVGPADGATVTSPVVLSFDIANLTLSPAGETQDGEGHLHVFVDQGCMQPGLIIPVSERTLHVGDGTMTVSVDLAPGPHDLCVQVGDGFHVAVAVQNRISVEVIDPLVGASSGRP